MVVENIQIYGVNDWKMELWLKKIKVDISTTPKPTFHGPYHWFQGRDRLLIPPVKGEDYENLVNFFKTFTLMCLINGARRLLIFRFFSDPPPPYGAF